MTVALDQDGNGGSNNQVTTYLYEDPYIAAHVTSIIYPDSSDTDSSGTDQVKMLYNLDGTLILKIDQNQTVIEYAYNDRRQLQLEAATTLGGNIDNYVLSIGREYDSLGRLTTITSYSNSDGTGTVRNQVVQSYADYGPVNTQWQSHSGAAVTSGGSQSPSVQYGFDTTATSGIYQNGLRLQQVTYPNARATYYQYGASAGDMNDLMRRVTHVRNANSSGQLLVQYYMLGSGQIIKAEDAEPQLRYTLLPGGTAGQYDGLDRFGRVKDLLWYNYGTSTNAVRIQHGYDFASNRIWRADPVAASNSVYLDEYYTYDGLNQVTSLTRGQLNSGKTGISGTPAKEEDWTLDALGNWPTYVHKTNGTTDLNQSRTHDLANEMTQINSSNTHVAEDAAGNMTKLPKPSNWSAHYDLTYDAWNRLVSVSDTGTTVAGYEYDGRNFRTIKRTYTGGSLSETRHFYYNSQWQCLEERLESGGTISSYANRQYVWGVRYMDDLVLRDRDADGNSGSGNLGISGSGLEERLYALQDPNWNVAAIADTSGGVQERYCYTAYGTPTVLTGSFGSRASTSYAWDALYTGRQYDPETGLNYYRNRYYGAELGRFPSRDPIQADINLYRYCANNPVLLVDPSGLLEVYVWPPADGRYGHAAIKLDNGTYISWWPQSNNRNYGFLNWGYPFNSYSVPAIPNRPFGNDVKDEGNNQPNKTRIDGLDEGAIQKWWDTFRNDPSSRWCTASGNCSTTAADALKAGGADVDWPDIGKAHNAIWTPNDVQKFADAIKRHLPPPPPVPPTPSAKPSETGAWDEFSQPGTCPSPPSGGK